MINGNAYFAYFNKIRDISTPIIKWPVHCFIK